MISRKFLIIGIVFILLILAVYFFIPSEHDTIELSIELIELKGRNVSFRCEIINIESVSIGAEHAELDPMDLSYDFFLTAPDGSVSRYDGTISTPDVHYYREIAPEESYPWDLNFHNLDMTGDYEIYIEYYGNIEIPSGSGSIEKGWKRSNTLEFTIE